MASDSNDSQSEGNTKTDRGARRWLFTLHYESENEIDNMIDSFNINKFQYIFGFEICPTTLKEHLQGYIETEKNQIRLSTLKKFNKRISWRIANGTRNENITYCKKDGKFISTFPKTAKEKMLEKYDMVIWREYQNFVINLLKEIPDERTIYWFYDEKGNIGKSFLCKYIALTHDVILCGGKSNDIKNQVLTHYKAHNENGPEIVICDIPRSNLEYINYTCMEELKNGLLYSGKYEGGQCIFPSPHVICFANEPPMEENLSQDRWKIYKINEEGLFIKKEEKIIKNKSIFKKVKE